MKKYYIITGGSGGIGYQFSKEIKKKNIYPISTYYKNKLNSNDSYHLDLSSSNSISKFTKSLASYKNIVGIFINASPKINLADLKQINKKKLYDQFNSIVCGHISLLNYVINNVFNESNSNEIIFNLTELIKKKSTLSQYLLPYIIAKNSLQIVSDVYKQKYPKINFIDIYPSFVDTNFISFLDRRFIENLEEQNLISTPKAIVDSIIKKSEIIKRL